MNASAARAAQRTAQRSAQRSAQNETRAPKTADKSALSQLLHALNQPLTGLQCSMEVALARERTVEQYVHGLREGLALTERMRALVEAIREITEIAEAPTGPMKSLALQDFLREAVQDLRPVAEAKDVRFALDFSSTSTVALPAETSELARVIFRLVDSAVSMAASATTLRIETEAGETDAGENAAVQNEALQNGAVQDEVRLRMKWQTQGVRMPFSAPELGMLIAQAWLERAGAEWRREENREGNNEHMTLTVCLPSGREE